MLPAQVETSVSAELCSQNAITRNIQKMISRVNVVLEREDDGILGGLERALCNRFYHILKQ